MKFSMPLLALLSVANAAAIEPRSENKAASFVSFEEWVKEIIADPEGDHLSPEEAILAHETLVNTTNIGALSIHWSLKKFMVLC